MTLNLRSTFRGRPCKAAIRRVVNEQSSLVFDLNLEAKVSSVFSKIWEKSETEQLSSTSLFQVIQYMHLQYTVTPPHTQQWGKIEESTTQSGRGGKHEEKHHSRFSLCLSPKHLHIETTLQHYSFDLRRIAAGSDGRKVGFACPLERRHRRRRRQRRRTTNQRRVLIIKHK